MARYEHLPIFQKTMELIVFLEKVVRDFSRYHKYGIGADLRELARRIMPLIIRANSTEQRTPVLEELVGACEQLKVMLAVAKEVKAFQSFASFQTAAGLATSLCRQSEGWLMSSKKGQHHQPHPGGDR